LRQRKTNTTRNRFRSQRSGRFASAANDAILGPHTRPAGAGAKRIECMNDSSQRFAELRTRYERSLPAKRATVDRAWRTFLASPDERGAVALQSIAHRLAGSATPYGYDAIGAAAQSLDARLSEWLRRAPGGRESADALATHLATPADALLDALARAIQTAPDSA
jgi:HPt (histidine-containing phosphotransfer) domain-containing protein